MSSLLNISLSYNSLSGSLPMDICYANLKLKELNLSSNHLSGKVPTGLGQCIKLQGISLSYNDFTGSIPSGIGNLVELQSLSLQNNSLTGEIPQSLFNISSLRFLNLEINNLEGEISSFSHCRELQVLKLSINQFTGGIPKALGSLSDLEELYLGYNKLTGSIPRDIGNLSKLEKIYLSTNSLIGSIPTSFGNLKALKFLQLGSNNLTGTIPEDIFNISKLQTLALAQNHLSGGLPSSIGTWLPDLEGLFIGGNEFSGTIPVSISNMSKLIRLHISDNYFTGNVPKDLSNLRKIEVLNLAGNQLTDEHLTSEVGFLTSLTNCKFLRTLWIDYNPLRGTLPNSLGNLSVALESFTASACHFRGTIPIGIGNLTNLIWLDLGANDLTGSIPTTLGQLQKLQRLYIAGNRIQGSIPNDLCHLKNLGYLHLSSNKFLRDLLVLSLSSNFLTGNLPPEVGNMKSITTLDLSKNLISGYIPRRMGELQNLVNLSLSQNKLHGSIPVEFGDLLSLESMDLSQKNLSGTIPKSLEALIYLKHLNVSFNKLQGEIPNGGPFVNFTAESFIFNEALCGAPHFQVIACDKNNHTQSWKTKSFILKYILLPVGSTVTLVAFIVMWIRRRDNTEIPAPIDSWLPGAHEKISQQQLLYATNDFEFQGALRSFDSECEVMQGICHRNLIRIITCCSNLDFKALVLEYMPKGSLDKWLYSHNYFLDLFQRLNIMIDVASALEYLHHDYSSLVVHCDLKPSNVLLDNNMVAHVADFGIARLLTETESMQQTKTLGTIGYMAPEYGSDGIVSTKGDVYSYGILLMEVFARKKPMDEMFTRDVTLKTWVESLSSSVIEVVDANLLRRDDEDLATKLSYLSSLMALALACTADSPEERINMKDMVVELKKIKIKLLM
ncbi:putative LRR receptor-like serine/threonine-protein kinase [Vitis vinifera]|uniref:non-specific serine/threonine protein kinase n=1 Tax=Vitis vinifera TaxID=29760 RepID=A0A438C6M7_VITVI|nr:putative LRR receptor-like serine/threonine-protein kinase [Vitis vinifera]